MALLSGAAMLAGCGLIVPHWTYRYRLTVEVERDGKVHAGSGIIEVWRGKGIDGIGGRSRGEAVAVDLGEAGVLFAILRGERGGVDWPFHVAHHAFRAQLGTADMVNEAVLDQLERMKGASATLSAEDYPMLVRFRDIADPRTVEQVDPANLAASFGPGYTLRRITVQITDEPVTKGIEKRLGWLSNYRGKKLDGQRFNNSSALANSLSAGSFSSEVGR